MPNKLQDPYCHKFVQAKYKISNSREYDQSLKNRGSLTIWFSEDAVAKWNNPVLNIESVAIKSSTPTLLLRHVLCLD